ncbi:MAG: hypothetical protein WC738_06190 [Candidatus Omnitrophota bacterium]
MKKNMKGILAGLVILVVGLLAINCYFADLKAKEAAKEITALNVLIQQKDEMISKLTTDIAANQQLLERAKKELESVKTELSNTVLRLQAAAAPVVTTPAKVLTPTAAKRK